ncbi:hypothetical protein [Sedimenticola hydrogenitrophicus]|uniref:hypothetical protein n=1 Tax=Sedimenticola hydrogenitrophicus TaxID=2967975 RepID=UPI0021A81C33|nr:hypothetical protein [Sedimenticola hydrogenitrophicus]
MPSSRHTPVSSARRPYGVPTLLFLLLWLWSGLLSAAWCVNDIDHPFDRTGDPGVLQTRDKPGHHTVVCQRASSNPLSVVGGNTFQRNKDSGSADLITAPQAPLPLSPGATKAAPPRFHEVSAFTSPPLYLLFQKLLLPFTV